MPSRPQQPSVAPPPPVALRHDVVETLHGVEVHDPYRWLEHETDPRVQRWVAAQDDSTRALLHALPARPAFSRRVGQLLGVGSVGAPVARGGRLFFTRLRPGQNQPVLRVRRGTRERTLLDPNALSVDGIVALDWWYPSEDGRVIAYGLSVGGDEQSTLHLRRVGNGMELADRIPRTRAASLAWLPDASGFYYTRYPAPGSVPSGEEHYHRRVYLHHLGTESADDPEVFRSADPQGWPHAALSADGRYLLVLVLHGWARGDLFLADLRAADPTPSPIVLGDNALYDGEFGGGVLYVRTNEGAPSYRLFAVDPANPARERWREVVAEQAQTLSGFSVAAGRLALHYLQDATSRLALHDLDGTYLADVPLPSTGSVTGFDGERHGDTLYFGFTSFAAPLAAYAYRPGDASPAVVAAPRTPPWLAELDVRVERVFYPSLDGTRIPMFVLRRPDTPLDGDRPTILTGYGGFNVSRTPAYAASALAWVERGGVWALANLRGGGEYGESWHRAGMLGNKQNVFDDFIAAAEWLIGERYTNPRRLAISGGSNGGLLVGAALTQRPDLFRAVLCAVPLLDMLRYHLFRIARLWVPEYGLAEDAEQFRWLYAYSPYHHVRAGERYPAVLITTGESDSRVDPLHARKMAALLQAESGSGLPVLLRVERQAGHGVGKPLTKLVDEAADTLAFLAWQTGLEDA